MSIEKQIMSVIDRIIKQKTKDLASRLEQLESRHEILKENTEGDINRLRRRQRLYEIRCKWYKTYDRGFTGCTNPTKLKELGVDSNMGTVPLEVREHCLNGTADCWEAKNKTEEGSQ